LIISKICCSSPGRDDVYAQYLDGGVLLGKGVLLGRGVLLGIGVSLGMGVSDGGRGVFVQVAGVRFGVFVGSGVLGVLVGAGVFVGRGVFVAAGVDFSVVG
jgi:acetyltransferase-like isoleucine patch superfamily enzyme